MASLRPRSSTVRGPERAPVSSGYVHSVSRGAGGRSPRRRTKADLILAMPASASANEVQAAARGAGVQVSVGYIQEVRWRARRAA